MTRGSSGSLAPQAETSARGTLAQGLVGHFVTFEGIEGSGKTTQIGRLAERLTEIGETVVVTREPGGTPLGARLRGLLLDAEAPPDPTAELLLYVADRAQHLADVVEPALAVGSTVLCDRYVDATIAYQGYGRGLDLEWIRTLHRHGPFIRRPVRTFLLDLDPEIGLARARDRNRALGIERTEGRFEAEALEFHRRVRDGYLRLASAEPFRFRIVAAEDDTDVLAARIADLVSDLFPSLEDDEP